MKIEWNPFKKTGGMRIATRITLLYGSIFAVMFILTSIFILLNANLYYRDTSKKELDQTADKVAAHIQNGGSINEEALRGLNPNKYVEIKVFNVTERASVVLFSDTVPDTGFPEQHPAPDTIPAERVKARMFVKPAFPRYMFDERIVTYRDDTYAIQVFRQYAREHQVLRLFTILFAGVNILGITGAFLIGRYISSLMLKPITNIRQTADRISIEDLSRRIPVEGPDDELKELSITFNDMIDRLETSFVKQNQFVSDASHELRTPISVIQGYANLIDRWGKKDAAILQESIDSIKAETEHMGTLTKKLLFMARVDQNTLRPQNMPLSLNSLAAEAAREMAVTAQDREIVLEADSEETIDGDYDLLKQMLWIFIENSVKYTSNHTGRIVLRIYRKEDRSCVSVIDNGIGISAEDLPLIFERFYRADKSRSNEVPGTGLGLSIALRIIQRHNAVVDAKSVPGQGTEMIVCFPVYTEKM